ncbi:MAG TPA: ester cyclase [Symbiobacteriaceae bacterium]|nr:ester cyclase [Symbiobacteriaceae bacterium]
MRAYDPIKIAKAHLELWNNHHPIPYKELLAPAATFRFIFEKVERPAVKAIEEYEILLRTACPDMRLEHLDVIPAEGTLTLEWIAQGTHLGKILEIEPTGRRVQIQGTTVLKINEDGKIVKETNYVDLSAVMIQIGMVITTRIPEPERLREIAMTLIETVNRRNIEKLITLFAPHPVLKFNQIISETRLNQLLIDALVAIPDLQVQPIQVAIRGTEVVLEVVGTATHTGPVAEIEPTGKQIKIEGCIVLTFVGEKIAKLRLYVDQYNLLAQIGKVPELVVK